MAQPGKAVPPGLDRAQIVWEQMKCFSDTKMSNLCKGFFFKIVPLKVMIPFPSLVWITHFSFSPNYFLTFLL